MADRHGELWSQDEMAAAVDAYVEMLWLQARGSIFTESDVVRQLRKGPLAGRTKKSVEYRFRNISSILVEHSRPYVNGIRPKPNVGPRGSKMIIDILSQRGFDL